MNTIFYIKTEFSELKKMPYFLGRLVCFSILFALDELTVTHFESPYLYYFIGALAVFFIPSVVMEALALDQAKVKLKLSWPLILWLVVGFIATVNEVSYGLLNGVTPIYLAPVFWFFIPVMALCGKEKGFYKLFLLSCIGPILFNIISGIILFPFANNVFALGVSGFVPLVLISLESSIKRRNYAISIVSLIFSSLSMVLLYYSLGRTGFLASLLALPVFALMTVLVSRVERKGGICSEKRLSVFSIAFVFIFVLSALSVLLYFASIEPLPYSEWITDEPCTAIEKFVFSFKNNNLLSNRAVIWKYTFDNFSLIGNGPFFYMGDTGYWHAHNSFIAVLGHYGIIPFILYCIFFILMFVTSVKYSFRAKFLRYLPFVTIFTYFIASMTEDLACIVVPRMFSVVFYFVCALLINEYPNVVKKV